MAENDRPVPNEPQEPAPLEAKTRRVTRLVDHQGPVHDLDVEAALLSAVLTDALRAWPEVAGVGAQSFYWPSYGHVFSAMEALAADGEQIHLTTVSDRLRRMGLLELVSLAHNPSITATAALSALLAMPEADAGRAKDFAAVVSRLAAARRLRFAAGQLVDAAQSANLEAALPALESATEVLAAVEAAQTSWNPVDLAELLAGGLVPLVPTLLARDDGEHLLYEGRIHSFNAEPESGKAQPLTSRVLTPAGWRQMGDLAVGDRVIGSDGRSTEITGVFPQGEVPIYRVVCSDGASTECCGQHLWWVESHNNRVRNQPGRALTTEEIANLLVEGKRRETYLPMVAPVKHAERELLIDPYGLGLLLGDGCLLNHVNFSSGDDELFDALQVALGDEVVVRRTQDGTSAWVGRHERRRGRNSVRDALDELGLIGWRSEEKFIPPAYLRGSVEQRLALIQGLMDTDGGVEGSGTVFYSSSVMLALGMQELVESLGGTASLSKRTPTYRVRGELREGLTAFRLHVRMPASVGCPFRLRRKVEAWGQARTIAHQPPVRKIVAVEYVGTKPAQCIRVSAADHLYVTEHHLVTHNSLLSTLLCAEEIRAGRDALYIDFEADAESVIERVLAFGVTADSLVSHFVYVRPDDPLDLAAQVRIEQLTSERAFSVCVIDGVAEAMMLGGWDENVNAEVAAFLRALPRRLERTGAAVVLIDHVVKNPRERVRGGRGAGHKLAGITVSYGLEVAQPFGRGKTGRARLVLEKDRGGWLRSLGGGQRRPTLATFELVSDEDGSSLVGRLVAGTSGGSDADEFRPTGYMERVSRVLEESSVALSGRQIRSLVKGGNEYIDLALAALVAEGFAVVDGARRQGGGALHRSARPYREDEADSAGSGGSGGSVRDFSEGSDAPREEDF